MDPGPSPGQALDTGDGCPGAADYNDAGTVMQMLGLPPPKTMPPDELRQAAREKSNAIFDGYDRLRQVLDRHEATIQKRWAKKTRQQRLKVLLQAWPSMPVMHRPDLDDFRKDTGAPRPADEGTARHHDAYLCPCINQEDLAKAKTLLLLLNSRGRHPPCTFAVADAHAMRLGIMTKNVVPIFLNEFVMVLNGATTREDYGTLLAWGDHPDAFYWMHTKRQFLPGEGLLVLEAQEKLMPFLLDCCRQILHEIPTEDLASDAFPVLPEPQIKTENPEAAGCERLTVQAQEAPYRVPAKFDLGRMVSLLAARTSAAEDHIWALREDPGYFVDNLKDLKEHRQEILMDSDGKPHPAMGKSPKRVLWARSLSEAVREAYLLYEVFADLLLQAQNLRVLQAQFEDEISPEKDLPSDYLYALLRFRHYLEQAAKGPKKQLRHGLPSSPNMRRLFVRESPPNVPTSIIHITSKPQIKMTKVEVQVLWLLKALFDDGGQLLPAGQSFLIDELERLLETQPEAKEMISARIAGIIGNLSILTQCLDQFDLCQPWAGGFAVKLVECNRDEEIKKEFADHARSHAAMLQRMQESSLGEAVRLGDPSGARFAYPIGKRQTKANVEALRQAESNLDTFWSSIDRLMYAKAGGLKGTATRWLLSQSRILKRTPEWVDPPPTGEGPPDGDEHRDGLNKPLSTLYFRLENHKSIPTNSSILSLFKQKFKLGETIDTVTAARQGDGQPEAKSTADQRPVLYVDGRAHKVFRTLFFNPRGTSSTMPGEISWSDFLHAMTSTGFKAEKMYGSVWQFQPMTLDVDRGIQFQEPHPRGRIRFEVARRHGRRLSRAYGWTGATFVLKE